MWCVMFAVDSQQPSCVDDLKRQKTSSLGRLTHSVDLYRTALGGHERAACLCGAGCACINK